MVAKKQFHINVSLNSNPNPKTAYDVCEMFACGCDGTLYLGCINPKYLDGFIAAMSAFARAHNCTVDYLTKTYYI